MEILTCFALAPESNACTTPPQVNGWSNFAIFESSISRCASFHFDSPWRMKKIRTAFLDLFA